MKIIITESYQNFRKGEILTYLDETKTMYIGMRNRESVLIPKEYCIVE